MNLGTDCSENEISFKFYLIICFLFYRLTMPKPLSAKERQRRRREKIKNDPVKFAEHKDKERQRWHKRKSQGKVKTVSEMSERENRKQKRDWKDRQRKCRSKNATQLSNSQNFELYLERIENQVQHTAAKRKEKSPRYSYNRAQKKLDQLNKKLSEECIKHKKESGRYKQKYYRMLRQVSDVTTTPRKTVKKMFHSGTKSVLRKKLLFSEVLFAQLRQKYRNASSEKEKRGMTNVLSGKIIAKYRMQNMLRNTIGLSRRQCQNNTKTDNVKFPQRMKYQSISIKLRSNVRSFFLRDDNSVATSGKKDTRTKFGQKVQRRLLKGTLKSLFHKYKAENAESQISYTVFCRLRPFWVESPKAQDRKTCQCKVHENTAFIVKAMHVNGLVSTSNPDELIKDIVCDVKSAECMFNECSVCRDKWPEFPSHDNTDEVMWEQWERKFEQREIKKQGKTEMCMVALTVKQKVHGTIGDLIDQFKDYMSKYISHVHIVQNQFLFCRSVKESMSPNECMIHIDFSENYIAKCSSEIQSMHFGASKNQITLHTGVLYVTGKQPFSFCSISDSLHHGPAAIWAHLDPVLDMIDTQFPEIDTVHFISDGPTSQYRQKSNFFMFNNMLKKHSFKCGTWNFLGSGHGKGAPDGVGASIKRLCDQQVLHGKDVRCAMDIYNLLLASNTSVQVFLIPSSAVEDKIKCLDTNKIKTIPGTMKIHQVICDGSNTIRYRPLSCYCTKNTCVCFGVKEHIFPSLEAPIVSQSYHDDKGNQTQAGRKKYYDTVLDSLKKCVTFDQIKSRSETLSDTFIIDGPIDIQVGELDHDSLQLLPGDIPSDFTMIPIKSSADGDCLPHTGSIIAFGQENLNSEIRVRIVQELCLHKNLYLSPEYLRQGIDVSDNEAKKLPGKFAMFSEHYLGGPLTETTIESIYTQEVVTISRQYTYMGIWQLFALSNVLNTRLFSVYPNLGNPNVRKDLNRWIHPRQPCGISKTDNQPAFIMWTSTRQDMNETHWVPNHFVPLMTVKTPVIESASIESGSEMVHTDQDFHLMSETQSIPSGSELLGKHVLVLYDGFPYPGIVTDFDEQDIFVNCMHRIGRNRFFWPQMRKDECWYSFDQLLAIIPKPKHVTDRHFEVEKQIWEEILSNLDI